MTAGTIDEVAVADLAGVMHADVARVASLVTLYGVEISADGRFPPEKLLEGMTRTLRAANAARDQASSATAQLVEAEQERILTMAAMGDDEESARRWLMRQLEERGVKVTGRAMRHAMRFTLQRSDGAIMRVLTYVALKPRANNRAAFAVSYLDDGGLDWVFFVAKPLATAFLRRRTEILENMQAGPTDSIKTANVTFSRLSMLNSLDSRFSEFMESKAWKKPASHEAAAKKKRNR